MCEPNTYTCCLCIPIKLGIFFIAVFCAITGAWIIYYGVLQADPALKNPYYSKADISLFVYHLLRVFIILVACTYFLCALLLPLSLVLQSNCFSFIANLISVANQVGFLLLVTCMLACSFSTKCVFKDNYFAVALVAIIGIFCWGYFISVLHTYSCNFHDTNRCCKSAPPCRKNIFSYLTGNIIKSIVPSNAAVECGNNNTGNYKCQAQNSRFSLKNFGRRRKRRTNASQCNSRKESCSSIQFQLTPSTSGSSCDASESEDDYKSRSKYRRSKNNTLTPHNKVYRTTSYQASEISLNHLQKSKKCNISSLCEKQANLKYQKERKDLTDCNNTFLNKEAPNELSRSKKSDEFTLNEQGHLGVALDKPNKVTNMPITCQVPKNQNPKIICNSSIDSVSSIVQRNNFIEVDSKNMSKVHSVRFKCKQAKDLLARKFFQGYRKNKTEAVTVDPRLNTKSAVKARTSSEIDLIMEEKDCEPQIANKLYCNAGTDDSEEEAHQPYKRRCEEKSLHHLASDSDDEMTTEQHDKQNKQPMHSLSARQNKQHVPSQNGSQYPMRSLSDRQNKQNVPSQNGSQNKQPEPCQNDKRPSRDASTDSLDLEFTCPPQRNIKMSSEIERNNASSDSDSHKKSHEILGKHQNYLTPEKQKGSEKSKNSRERGAQNKQPVPSQNGSQNKQPTPCQNDKRPSRDASTDSLDLEFTCPPQPNIKMSSEIERNTASSDSNSHKKSHEILGKHRNYLTPEKQKGSEKSKKSRERGARSDCLEQFTSVDCDSPENSHERLSGNQSHVPPKSQKGSENSKNFTEKGERFDYLEQKPSHQSNSTTESKGSIIKMSHKEICRSGKRNHTQKSSSVEKYSNNSSESVGTPRFSGKKRFGDDDYRRESPKVAHKKRMQRPNRERHSQERRHSKPHHTPTHLPTKANAQQVSDYCNADRFCQEFSKSTDELALTSASNDSEDKASVNCDDIETQLKVCKSNKKRKGKGDKKYKLKKCKNKECHAKKGFANDSSAKQKRSSSKEKKPSSKEKGKTRRSSSGSIGNSKSKIKRCSSEESLVESEQGTRTKFKDKKNIKESKDSCIEITVQSDGENCEKIKTKQVNSKKGRPCIRIVVGSSSEETFVNKAAGPFRKNMYEDEMMSSSDTETYRKRSFRVKPHRQNDSEMTPSPSQLETHMASSISNSYDISLAHFDTKDVHHRSQNHRKLRHHNDVQHDIKPRNRNSKRNI